MSDMPQRLAYPKILEKKFIQWHPGSYGHNSESVKRWFPRWHQWDASLLTGAKLLTKLAFFIFLLIQFLEGAATSMSYLKVSKSRTSTNGDFQKSICWIKCHHMTRNQCGSWVFFWLVFQVKVLTEANRYALSVWYPFPFFKMKFKWMLVIKHLLTSDFRIDRKKNIQSCQIFFCFLLKEEDTIFHSSFHSKE